MLMLGRGAVSDPGLALAIKADMTGAAADPAPAVITWHAMLPLVAEFWQLVCTRLDARSRAGRLKQWLNFLRRRFTEAETAYQQLKNINDPALIDGWLAGAVQMRQASATMPFYSLAHRKNP
jgi:tRNA-dihydrouridine synthase C